MSAILKATATAVFAVCISVAALSTAASAARLHSSAASMSYSSYSSSDAWMERASRNYGGGGY